MEEERRTRESKLRDRLSKKRKAKEEEMQKAAISDQVQQIPSIAFNDVPVFFITRNCHRSRKETYSGHPDGSRKWVYVVHTCFCRKQEKEAEQKRLEDEERSEQQRIQDLV